MEATYRPQPSVSRGVEEVRPLGKVDSSYFLKHISDKLGARRADVLLSPGYGLDYGLVDLGNGKAMAISTDPIWIERSFGLVRAAWFAFHTLVGDVCLSGLPPSHLALDWNLPVDISQGQFTKILKVFSEQAKHNGISIVAGHTGRYEGSAFPTIGGGTAMAVGSMKDVIRTDGARIGDSVLLTKTPAVETAIALCSRFPDEARDSLGNAALRRIFSRFRLMSVVEDARIAAAAGGVTSMHDASERGVAAALHEMSSASRVVIGFDRCKVSVDRDIAALCEELKIDPFSCSSQGTLLMTVDQKRAGGIQDALEEKGIECYKAGKVLGRGEGVFEMRKGGRRQMRVPRIDHLLKGLSTMQERQKS